MKLVYCLVTFNRLEYLKKHIITWDETRDKNHNWVLFIADDGSDDGTQEYLKNLNIDGIQIQFFFNKRRGVHYQVNQLLKLSSNVDFDLGFMAEDDIYFIQSGWDNLYAQAVKFSGFDFLCYFNKTWADKHGKSQHVRETCLYDPQKKIQSQVIAYNSFGCFWTFTKKLIQEVGYFDSINFGVWGNGHTDYALRCCRVGFNRNDALFDLYESEKYITMQDEDYKCAFHRRNNPDPGLIGVPNPGHKGITLDRSDRKYISYNESPFDMLGGKVDEKVHC